MTRLWDWAVQTYARPGVADACLELQDRHGMSVPLLLWTLWSREGGSRPDLEAGAQVARSWEVEAVGPLRRLRRALKALNSDPDREAVRDQVKAVELDAERRLLAALERLPALPGPPPPAPELLAAAAAAYGGPLSPESFTDLLRRLNLRAA
ncbi:MAG: TIGR02444 family protein [Proteobacteria bacterium]|nr:TIGR02444 family protein [Pseudomonadota bacterium]